MTATIKHTPAPWVVADLGREIHDRKTKYENGSRIGETPNVIAYVEPCPTMHRGIIDCEASRLANAHLIAAAPDLLAALKGMLAITSDSRGVAGYHLNGEEALWEEFNEVSSAIAAIAKAEGEQ